MTIRKVCTNVQKIIDEVVAQGVSFFPWSHYDTGGLSRLGYIEEVKTLINDLKDKGAVWAASQTEPVMFLDEKRKPWHKLVNHKKYVWGFVLYQNCLYEVPEWQPEENIRLIVLDLADSERKKFERLKTKFDSPDSREQTRRRTPIPEEARIAVWRRDQGRCVRCGSRENLEYDHIIPVSKGGNNTVRNVELLCENCNRAKGRNIQ